MADTANRPTDPDRRPPDPDLSDPDLSERDLSDPDLSEREQVDGEGGDGLEAARDSGDERRDRFRTALSALAGSSSADLTRWVMIPASLALLVGFNLMLFGWMGAAGTARQIEQIPYLISGGLMGLGLVIVGGLLLASAFWVAVARRMASEAEAQARAQVVLLEARLEQLAASAEAAATASAEAAAAATEAVTAGRRPAPARSSRSSTSASANGTAPTPRARRTSSKAATRRTTPS